jgi:putative acetyltransferase
MSEDSFEIRIDDDELVHARVGDILCWHGVGLYSARTPFNSTVMVRAMWLHGVAEIAIALESPRRPDVTVLIDRLDAYLVSLYPAESNHLLDIEALADGSVRFFVGRQRGEALGCGALRIDVTGYGEVKRMFVLPAARGLKIGKRILQRIEDQARAEGINYLRLEAGIRQPEALGLYRSAGFIEREAFGDYKPDPLSVFMEKAL